MLRSVLEYLRHILDEAIYLRDKSQELSFDDFIKDETIKRAFARSIEIIGEAAKQVPDDVRKKYPDIEWREIAGMRDHLIHGYFSVDYKNSLECRKGRSDSFDREYRTHHRTRIFGSIATLIFTTLS